MIWIYKKVISKFLRRTAFAFYNASHRLSHLDYLITRRLNKKEK